MASSKFSKQSKFSNEDRKLIIDEIERQEEALLRRVRRFRKLLCTPSDDFYCIIGGVGNWHGISESIIECVEAEASQGYLVVVIKQENRYEIYLGNFQPIIDNKSELLHAENGNCQFHIDRHEQKVCLREIADYCLELNQELSLNGVRISDATEESSEVSMNEGEILIAFDNFSARDQRLLLAKLTKRIK